MLRIRFGKQLLALAILAALLVLGACASAPASNPTASATTQSTPAASPTSTLPPPSTPASIAYTVNTASKGGMGDYLVDGKGMTLYYFTKDVIGKSTATGNVLAAWPIFNPAGFVVPSSLNAADFGTITREDGQKQATYKGWPLYYYAKDQASGDTLGEAVGGVWFVIKVPFYTVMLQTKADIGNYLVDAKGMTLYYFTKDSVGMSMATADVLKSWPIFNPADFTIPSSLKAADFGKITREDGQKQATYQGWPLYYFVKDQVSGDTAGQGVNSVWFVVNPEKFPPQPTPTSTAAPTPTPIPTSAPTATLPAPGPAVTVDLIALHFSFDKNAITVPAGASVTINFNNKDSGIPHNFALYTNSSGATAIFVGQIINGGTTTYKFTAPSAPGTYFFRCDVHPTTMTGSFIVTAASSGGGGY